MVSDQTIIEYDSSFKETFSAAGCLCVCDGDVLLIQRQQRKPFALHWGMPTGKLDPGESPAAAAIRELDEEIGLGLPESSLVLLNDLFVYNASASFRFTCYASMLSGKPTLRLKRDEVRRAAWVAIPLTRNRLSVPFLWDSIRDLTDWLEGEPLKRRLLPTPPASRANLVPR